MPVFAVTAIFIFALIIVLLPMIMYLLTLQNTLLKVSAENRKMPPSEVWLILIPIFGLVWHFIVVNRMADSLEAEFKMRNIQINEQKPGRDVGLAYLILACCSIIPILNFLTIIGALVCWIIYWVKINEYKVKLSVPYNRETTNMPTEQDWFNDTEKLNS